MKKLIVIAILMLATASCKTKQAATTVAEANASGSGSVNEVVAGHYKNKKEFSTLHLAADARYKDAKQTHNLTADIKIKKDEIILVSIKFFGITMAKALITPQRVSYYEKINSTYFDGNYAALSRWLGTDLDYAKVQNMLLGEAMDNLNKGTYKTTVDNGRYKLESKEKNIVKEFLFEGANYLIKQQTISQGGQQPRSLEISYPDHKEYPNAILPGAVKIEAVQKDRVNIDIEYNNVKFDESMTFPYSVPEGFEQIFID